MSKLIQLLKAGGVMAACAVGGSFLVSSMTDESKSSPLLQRYPNLVVDGHLLMDLTRLQMLVTMIYVDGNEHLEYVLAAFNQLVVLENSPKPCHYRSAYLRTLVSSNLTALTGLDYPIPQLNVEISTQCELLETNVTEIFNNICIT